MRLTVSTDQFPRVVERLNNLIIGGFCCRAGCAVVVKVYGNCLAESASRDV